MASPTRSPAAPTEIADLARSARRVVVLTGAGMSAESGLPTFREAQQGLWAKYDPMTLASPDAFRAEPDVVWAWYAWRREMIQQARPNAGHLALARWAELAEVEIVTQNVDDLHERAGSEVLAQLHGSIRALRCFDCARPYTDPIDWPTGQVERLPPPRCPACDGAIRPGIVWFDEPLPTHDLARAEAASLAADLMLVVGTSGLVYPAAGLPVTARYSGVPVVEINPVETSLSEHLTHRWRVTAAQGLPALVDVVAGGS
ncbi:SIR2 family NAD-dependent protein deacylase [Microlunatus sp. Y2014]|uniref:SIR2 family NAD-dependent protein deacylase n=1 Tax=Microlunatus sp. Y2014 TaxID=3418488 RepID=UPI003DA75851